jgi:hypothetical protein
VAFGPTKRPQLIGRAEYIRREAAD